MQRENATLLSELVLIGLTHRPQWKIPLFLLFLGVYFITVVGNLGLITLIWKDSHLHIPMYFFLGSLASVDASISSVVIPKMLGNFLMKTNTISLSQCMTQFFLLNLSATTECFLLAAMAYDRYAAICNPLHYPAIMTNKLCIRLIALSFIGGLLHAILHEGFLLRLTFCNSNTIHHFYCDIISLFKISCTDPSINYIIVFIFSGSIQVFTILTVLVSYTFVLFAILKKKSAKVIRKAFSTCGAHLFSVSLYYGPLLFMYVHPASQQVKDEEMIDSLFYTVIIPVLNPIIYSLRNKQVIDSVKRILKRNV
ncbi:olfactory receptor 187-like [Perognathus longimembris pacificus]|uniref:olfactory receptor 187-like n=1 Tax=Perognathus longimembris pacificus TaxID=214514 RepID=UPI002018CEA8|nr:olfactory receptor 187-like [Perognathus longimembris pacificus]